MSSKRKKTVRRKKKGSVLRALLAAALMCAGVAAALTCLLYTSGYGDGFSNSLYRADAFSGRRVLFLVPHEDDDLAMAGAVIRLYAAGGADVTVAFTTNGDDGFDPDTRAREAAAGLRKLGVGKERIVFLGYGNNWTLEPYRHVYHAPDDAVIASKIGKTETYGAGGFTDFHSSVFNEPASYTRSHYKQDLRYLLRMTAPDVIFCIDLDSHPDHATVSFLFEEVLGELLKEDGSYRPKVYKGYAYGVAWYGAADFYGDALASTRPPDAQNLNDPRFALDTPNYDWAERVRFPAPRDVLAHTLRGSRLFGALRAHASQDARFRAANIISGDTVFFERRTDSLLYAPGITLSASSGDPACLNDFKLVDTDNIYDYPMRFDRGVWRPEPDDPDRSVTVTFPTRVNVASVSLYDYYEPGSNITSGELRFSDGSTVAVGPLRVNGEETRVTFPARSVTSFTFAITGGTGDRPGLSELAAYGPATASDGGFIKLTLDDADETFLYRYPVARGASVPLRVYAYPDANAAVTLSVVSGDGSVALDNGTLRVSKQAAAGKHRVRAELADNPAVYDEIEIVVPGVLERPFYRLLAAYETLLDRAEGKLLSILHSWTKND